MEESVLSSFSTTDAPGVVCTRHYIWVLMCLAFGWGFDSPDSGPVSFTGGTQHIRTRLVKLYTSELLRSGNKPPFSGPFLLKSCLLLLILHEEQLQHVPPSSSAFVFKRHDHFFSCPPPLPPHTQKDAFPHASFGDPPTSRLSSVELCFQVPTLSHGVFLVTVPCLLCVCLTVTRDSRRRC